jgi:hypothetical protein
MFQRSSPLNKILPYSSGMLSRIHNQAYQEFLTLLTNFPTHSLNRDRTIDTKNWVDAFADLQTFFNNTIMPLTEGELNKQIVYRWQSLQTEIRREFRLLGTDILFLKSSRQPTTKLARGKAIDERIQKLMLYSQEILRTID